MGKLSASRHRNFYIALALGLIVGLVPFVLDRDLMIIVGVSVSFRDAADRRHDLSGGAVAALKRVVIDESLLLQ